MLRVTAMTFARFLWHLSVSWLFAKTLGPPGQCNAQQRDCRRTFIAGTISKTEIEKTYKISRRIEAEERGLDGAMMVFTSTQQEVDEQWGLYEG